MRAGQGPEGQAGTGWAGLRLELTDLACTRGERPVFTGLTQILTSGEALLVTGRNGAGKSSLLRLVAGLLRPAAGTVVLQGGDAERTTGEQAHYVGHADALKTALTARENLADWQALFGTPWIAPDEALDQLGLAHLAELPAGYASAGQRRRLALARLLLNRRPLWLLDEPSAALDAATQDWLAETLRRHLGEGGLVIAATHADLGLLDARRLELGR